MYARIAYYPLNCTQYMNRQNIIYFLFNFFTSKWRFNCFYILEKTHIINTYTRIISIYFVFHINKTHTYLRCFSFKSHFPTDDVAIWRVTKAAARSRDATQLVENNIVWIIIIFIHFHIGDWCTVYVWLLVSMSVSMLRQCVYQQYSDRHMLT